MTNQEIIIQLSLLEQQAGKVEEQIRLVDQQVSELQNLGINLKDINESKEKDIYAGLGRGIFMPAEIKARELLVDIGSKTLVKKNFDEVERLIEKQVEELLRVRVSLIEDISKLNAEMERLVSEVRQEKSE